MAKPNAFMERIEAEKDLLVVAVTNTIKQFLGDIYGLVLTDEDVLGDKALSLEEAQKVIDAADELYFKFHDAITTNENADEMRGRLDNALKKIPGGENLELPPFEERYPELKRINRDKPVRTNQKRRRH